MPFPPSIITLENSNRSVSHQIPDLTVNMCILHHIRQNTLHISTTDSVISFLSLLWPYYEYLLSPSGNPSPLKLHHLYRHIFIFRMCLSLLRLLPFSDGIDKNTSWGSYYHQSRSFAVSYGNLQLVPRMVVLFPKWMSHLEEVSDGWMSLGKLLQ